MNAAAWSHGVRASIIGSAIAFAAAAGVAMLQPRLAVAAKRAKETGDVWVLPPPAQLKASTLGYHAAATDLLWAKLLVEYGMHWHDRREFDDLPHYLDAILELEPDYAPLYRYVDTLLVYRPPRGTDADARLAREYLERGTRERPFDHRVWMAYGQFIAFVAPSFLTAKSPEEASAERERWRMDGARAIAHAVDLGADPDRAISSATILSKSGERSAAIKSLERAYALTDDQSERDQIAAKLSQLTGAAKMETAARDMQFIEGRWRKDFPFLTRGEYLLIGPEADDRGAYQCAGRDASPACATDWSARLPSAGESP